MTWSELQNKIYYWDGAWRDLYIFQTTREDWQKWVNYVNQNHRIDWYNGKTAKDESKIDFRVVDEFWNGNHDLSSTAKVFIDTIQINAHFFMDTEIENDIDPREFESIEDHYKLIQYMTDLSNLLDKPVILTPENEPETALIKVYRTSINYPKNSITDQWETKRNDEMKPKLGLIRFFRALFSRK